MSTNKTAYWCKNRIRITGEGPDGALHMELDKPCALIGTHGRADLVLKGSGISRRHLYLHAADGGIYCVDLDKGRRRKSLVGGWIKSDQTVRVGPYKFQFGFVSGNVFQFEDDSVNLLASKSADRPFPALHCSTDKSPLGNHDLTRRLSILGRARPCSIQFVSRTISPEHCVVYQESGQIWIVDLLSSSKTRLDGQAINIARLGTDQVIKIGRVTIDIQRSNEPNRHVRLSGIQGVPPDIESGVVIQSDNVRRDEQLDESMTSLQPPIQQDKSDSAHLLAEIVILKGALEEIRDENRRLVALMADQLNDIQRDNEKRQKQREQEDADFQKLALEFDSQRKSSEKEHQQMQIEHGLKLQQLEQKEKQLAADRIEFEKERETALQHIVTTENDFQNRHQQLIDLEPMKKQLADDLAQFEEQQQLWSSTREQCENDAEQLHLKMRDELKAEQQSLAAARENLERERLEFQQRQQIWLVEQKQEYDQLQSASDQLQERENRLEKEKGEFESQQQTQWEHDQELQAETPVTNSELFEEQKAELAAAREKLDADQREFDRYVTIDVTQQQVLTNMNKLKSEKAVLRRFWVRLFRRSDG